MLVGSGEQVQVVEALEPWTLMLGVDTEQACVICLSL